MPTDRDEPRLLTHRPPERTTPTLASTAATQEPRGAVAPPSTAPRPPSDRHRRDADRNSSTSSRSSPSSTPNASATAVYRILAAALPRLWHYALERPDFTEPREHRRKLRELIGWLLTKRGYRITAQVATPYLVAGKTVRGRLELLVLTQQGAPVLALESDWAVDNDSLRKLTVWRERGVATLWIVGRPCESTELHLIRRLANRTLKEDTGPWLAIFHLEHGWIRRRAPPPAAY